MGIPRKKKPCVGCGNVVIILAHGLGQCCAPKYPIKKQALKKKPHVKTGEGELFLKIWNEREHICSNCKDPLGEEPLAQFFSHILSKKQRPDLILEPTNILLRCFDCHYIKDFGTKDQFDARTKK